MKFDILNRWSGKVQFTADIDANELTPLPIKTGMALEWGRWNISDMSGAVFSGARLTNSELVDADLNHVVINNANLSHTDCTQTNFDGADLSGTDFAHGGFRYATLRNADLRYVNFAWAFIDFTDMTGADLRWADFTSLTCQSLLLNNADLRNADIRDTFSAHIEALDSKILAALAAGAVLDMDDWRAGGSIWSRGALAVELAGDAGKKMVRQLGEHAAAAFIYATAYPNMRVPDFFADTADALADIKMRAGLDAMNADISKPSAP